MARVTSTDSVDYDDTDDVVGVDEGYDGYNEYEGYEGEEDAQPAGMFSSPERRMAMGGAVLMLLLVFGAALWLLNSSADSTSTKTPGQGTGASVGKFAPDFQLVDVRTNQTVKLSDLRGKPVFLNFWGTWCPPCRAEMPEMQKVQDKLQNDIAMVGISMAPRDDPSMVKTFVDEYKYGWTFIHDASQQTMADYQVFSVPSSYFIDKDGVIRSVKIGAFLSGEEIESYLQQAR